MSEGVSRRRLLTLAPLGVAGAAGIGFWAILSGMRGGSFDPHDIHAPALDRPVPDFTLPDQPPGRGFSGAELRAATRPLLVNFFASWCIPCVIEAPLLTAVAGRLPIWGIAYKDRPDDAAGFVTRRRQPLRPPGRRPRRPHGDRLGRLRRAGELSDPPWRHHRLAPCRTADPARGRCAHG